MKFTKPNKNNVITIFDINSYEELLGLIALNVPKRLVSPSNIPEEKNRLLEGMTFEMKYLKQYEEARAHAARALNTHRVWVQMSFKHYKKVAAILAIMDSIKPEFLSSLTECDYDNGMFKFVTHSKTSGINILYYWNVSNVFFIFTNRGPVLVFEPEQQLVNPVESILDIIGKNAKPLEFVKD